MPLTLERVKRVFKLANRTIGDPNPSLSPEKVREFLQVSYPELASASIHGPVVENKVAEYTFKVSIGTKG